MSELSGISYTVYLDAKTNELKARIWEDRESIGYTHRDCIRECLYHGHTPLSNGVLTYDLTTDMWLPIFEESLTKKRTTSELRQQIDTACQMAEQSLHDRADIKQILGQQWEKYIANVQTEMVTRQMPEAAIKIHIDNLRRNRYY